MKRIIIASLLLLSMTIQSFAQSSNADAMAQKRDSLNAAATAPDFIHASILLMSEGNEIYSIMGHAALRLQCPSKKLDYCFTFEMNMDESSWIDFLTHSAKAGFAPTETTVFLKQYKESGRGVTQYKLNLSPKEKQRLWQVLDEQAADGATWTFDYYHVSCTSMVFFAINSCLQRGDHLSFHRINPVLLQNYFAVTNYSLASYAWSRYFWNTVNMGKGNEQGEPTDMMTPKLMEESLPNMMITDSLSHQRPLIIGKSIQLAPQTMTPQPCWFTPKMAIALILALFVLIISLFIQKRRGQRKEERQQQVKKTRKKNQHK
jgi:hypothetical protein